MSDMGFFQHIFRPYSFQNEGQEYSISPDEQRDIRIKALVIGTFSLGIGGVIYFYAATDSAKRKLIHHINENLPADATTIDEVARQRLSYPLRAQKMFRFMSKVPTHLSDWLKQTVDTKPQTFTVDDWNDPSILVFGICEKVTVDSEEMKQSLHLHGHNKECEFLSNKFSSPLKIDGKSFSSVEHYCQETDGDEEQNMKKALWIKFVQPDGRPTGLGQKLKATYNWPLINGNHTDETWGMKIHCCEDQAEFCGENRLGKLLMELRSFLHYPF